MTACIECGKTYTSRTSDRCITCLTLSPTPTDAERRMVLDDHLDLMRRHPRYFVNRHIDDLPNLDHFPNPHSGSIIAL